MLTIQEFKTKETSLRVDTIRSMVVGETTQIENIRKNFNSWIR